MNKTLTAVRNFLASVLPALRVRLIALRAFVVLWVDRIIDLMDRVPGLPDYRSVGYVLSDFEKTQQRLAKAQAVASQRAEALYDQADRLADMAEAAEADADRAATVQLRLSRLLG